VLKAAREAGATFAGKVLLRLPGPVKEVFEQRLRAALPLRAEKVLRRIRDTRGGKLNDARFGSRGKGEGVYADAIHALFDQTAKRLGFRTGLEFPSNTRDTFERPLGKKGQLGLF
jgi:DNA repair photolyase